MYHFLENNKWSGRGEEGGGGGEGNGGKT